MPGWRRRSQFQHSRNFTRSFVTGLLTAVWPYHHIEIETNVKAYTGSRMQTLWNDKSTWIIAGVLVHVDGCRYAWIVASECMQRWPHSLRLAIFCSMCRMYWVLKDPQKNFTVIGEKRLTFMSPFTKTGIDANPLKSNIEIMSELSLLNDWIAQDWVQRRV